MEIANKIIEIALKYLFKIYCQHGHFFNTLKIKNKTKAEFNFSNRVLKR